MSGASLSRTNIFFFFGFYSLKFTMLFFNFNSFDNSLYGFESSVIFYSILAHSICIYIDGIRSVFRFYLVHFKFLVFGED